MAILTTAIVTAVMAAGAGAYYATNGFGLSNKTKSSLDIQREREAAKLVEQAQNTRESNGRYFTPVKEKGLVGTRPISAVQATQPTQAIKPTIATLPTLQTGYRWQEISKPINDQLQQQSQVFVDRYDTRANNGPLSTLINSYKNSGNFLKESTVPRWALGLMTLGFSEVYANTASMIDNYIWDIDGDGTDSMIKNVMVDPVIESFKDVNNFGDALTAIGQSGLGVALNTLNGASEVLDILANPIKGIANNGWQGFLDSFGLGGNGYVVYDWDTGNFALDLILEIFSDPTAVVGAIKSGANAIARGTKSGLKSFGTVALEEVGEQASAKDVKKAMQKAQKAVAKQTAGLADDVAAKASTYTDDLLRIVYDQGQAVAYKQAGNLATDTVTQIVTEGGKPVVKQVNLIEKGTDGLVKASQGFIDDTKSLLIKRVTKEADALHIPLNQFTLSQIEAGVSNYIKGIDFDKVAAQIIASTGYTKTQAKFVKASKIAGWLTQQNLALDSFQKGLNKIAFYGTNPALPLINKMVAKPLAKVGGDVLSTLWAKITNSGAYRFQEAVANAMEELTPESYMLLRDTFSWSSRDIAKALVNNTKVSGKKVIEESKLLPQIAEGAFQRQWVSKLTRDTRYYNSLLKNYSDNVTEITRDWEQYISNQYHKNATEYLKFLQTINDIELKATGNGAYHTFIKQIKFNNALIETNVLSEALSNPETRNQVKLLASKGVQGSRLSATQLKEINPNIEIMTPDEYATKRTTLAENQAFIQTNNKVVVQNEMYDKLSKDLAEYTKSEGKAGLFADLVKAGYESEVKLIVEELEHAQRLDQALKLFRANPGLYVPARTSKLNIKDQDIYTALADTFMGLNNKLAKSDDLNLIAYEMAAIAELQLKNYANITEDITGLLTNDLDFMANLKATLKLYIDVIPDNKPLITELKDSLGIFNSLKQSLEQAGNSQADLYKRVNTLFEDLQNITAKASDGIIVLPTELFRTGVDLNDCTSIHEALMKAAQGNFAGTLTTIADGRNLGEYFGGVDPKLTFDRKVVDSAQQISNGAASIQHKIYHNNFTTEAEERINTAWNDLLDAFRNNPNKFRNDQYYTELTHILGATKELNVSQKYSLIKYLYDAYGECSNDLINNFSAIVYSYVKADAQHELLRDIKNFRHLTNRPVTIGVGLDVERARRITLTPTQQRASADLQDIMAEKIQIERGIESLEAQLRNVSNADPLIAQHLVQAKAVQEFYNMHIAEYKNYIEGAIDQGAIMHNLDLARSEEARKFLSEEDIQTLEDLYSGVTDVEPEKIKQLEQRIDAYNSSLISPELFQYEIESILTDATQDYKGTVESFTRVRNKLKAGEELTDIEKRLHKAYKDLLKDYDEFVELMTKSELSQEELKKLYTNKLYRKKIEAQENKQGALLYEGMLPNAVKNAFIQQYNMTNKTHILLENNSRISYTTNAGYKIILDTSYLTNALNLKFNFRHEAAHSALAHKSTTEHNKFVDQFWNHLMKGENADYAKQLYAATWWAYYRDPDPKSRGFYFPNGNIFSWENRAIKEEVINNLIAARDLTDPVAKLDRISKGYGKHIEFDPDVVGFKRADINWNAKFVLDEDTMQLIDINYNKLLQDSVKSSPNHIYRMPALHEGSKLELNKPFLGVGEIMHDFRNAAHSRNLNMMRRRLSQSAEDFAIDLARNGPFQFYSISTLKAAKGDYSLFKYFDKDMNLRPKEIAKLKEFGIGIEVIEEMDTVMFYIDKSSITYSKGASYYKHNGVFKRVNYNAKDFSYNAKRFKMIDRAGESFNNAAHEIAGQATGYSQGFRIDEHFMNTLFNGTQDGFSEEFPSWIGLNNLKKNIGGWTLDDFTIGTQLADKYYPVYRFNEMLMGDYSYARRFGAYYSSNPMVNMSNALQQMQMMNKTKTEMLAMYFDDTFSIKNGIWNKYSNEDLFKVYQKHPEYALITMRGKTKKGKLTEQTTSGLTKALLGKDWNPVRIQELIPKSIKDIAIAREIGARLVPRSWYNMMYNTINNRIGSGGILKWVNKYNFIYKFFTLASNAMTYVRNAFDTYLKNTVELGDDMGRWTSYAWKLSADYQDINRILQERGIFGEKAIKEFFESGQANAFTRIKDMTYDMYKDLKHYEAWGPSTQGLADAIKESAKTGADTLSELTDDELMRNVAKEIVPGYKGVWETAVDLTGKIFDIGNNTIGFKAEKVNRLALYMKAMSEGKTREQAFQWIRKVHFDYSVRSLPEQVNEVLMPFITFTTKNLEYWIQTIATEPWVAKYLTKYFQTQFNYYDFTPEQMAASSQWQNMILSGNVPLWKRESDGFQAYFKLSPSFADAFNTFINPIEVAKNRLFFPTRALEKTFTTDYKGQNLMGKQDTWSKVLDWTSQIPGNALARRITNAIKQPNTLSTVTELTGAIGYMNMTPYTPRSYGYKTKFKYVYNNGTYSKRLQSTPYYRTKDLSKQIQYAQMGRQINRWKRARDTTAGRRILDPYRPMGQKLAKRLYFKTYPQKQITGLMPTYNTRQKRLFSMTQYRVQRALFNR